MVVLLSRLPRLRPRIGVGAGIDDFQMQHHRVVLVHDVMAVERVPSKEIAEAEEQPLIVAGLETRHVLAALLYQRRGGRRPPIDGESLELLEVHVDRMMPARSLVLPIPYLDGILQHPEADVLAGEDLIVDPPVAAILESEIARDPRRRGRGREAVE